MAHYYIDALISIFAGLYALLLGLGVKLPPEKLRKKKYAAIAGVFIIIGGLASLIPHIHQRDIFHPDASATVAGMKKKLTLPAEIDRVTRLDDVKADHDKIIYVMTVMSPRDDALDRTGFLRVYLHEQACKSDTYLALLKAGFTVVIDYRDLDKKELDTVTLKPEECFPLPPE